MTDLATGIEDIGLAATDRMLAHLSVYLSALETYNAHTNLVSSADPETVVFNHILDSMALVPLLSKWSDDKRPVRLVDIGSGAGFPAVILAVAIEDLEVLLVESNGKKTRFLEEVTAEIGLGSRVSVLRERAEIAGRRTELRETYRVATARALGPADLIAELALPFLEPGGALLAQKTEKQLQEEIPRAEACAPVLGGAYRGAEEVKSFGLDSKRMVMVIEKIGTTPGRFPRTSARMKKSPLGVK